MKDRKSKNTKPLTASLSPSAGVSRSFISSPSVSPIFGTDIPDNFAGTVKDYVDFQSRNYAPFEPIPIAEDDLKEVRKVIQQEIKNVKIEDQIVTLLRNELRKVSIEKKISTEVDEKIREKTERIQMKSVEMLGVFVALFTFISVDFSFLKDSRNFEASVSFILIAGGLLLAFLLVMDMMLFPNLERGTSKEKIVSGWRILFEKRLLIFLSIISLLGFGLWYLERSIEKEKNGPEKQDGLIKIEQNLNQRNNQKVYE